MTRDEDVWGRIRRGMEKILGRGVQVPTEHLQAVSDLWNTRYKEYRTWQSRGRAQYSTGKNGFYITPALFSSSSSSSYFKDITRIS